MSVSKLNNSLVRAAWVSVLVLLSACQSRALLPTQPLPSSVEALHNWNLSGRIGYRAGNDGGSASLDWRQRHLDGEMRFSGPVGIGSARLFWSPRSVTLDTGKEQFEAASSAELAWRLTGLWLPVEALQFKLPAFLCPNTNGQKHAINKAQLEQPNKQNGRLNFSNNQQINQCSWPKKIPASNQSHRS